MKESLKEMYQVLLTEPHAPTVCTKLERIAREALAQPEQEPDYKVLWEQMCERCDELDKKLAQPEQEPDRFCDSNCIWSDHHPDCKYVPQESDELTIAYMSGLYDGKKQAKPEQDTEAHYKGVIDDVQKLFDDKRKVQQEQEPVAVKHMMEWVDYLKRKSDYGQHLQIPSEMSAGACWDLARELEQFITTPPQRTWVELTDEEAQWLYDNCRTPSNLIDMTEAKLKDLNT